LSYGGEQSPLYRETAAWLNNSWRCRGWSHHIGYSDLL